MQRASSGRTAGSVLLSLLALCPYAHANPGAPGFQHLFHPFHEFLGFGVRSIRGQILICYLSDVKL